MVRTTEYYGEHSRSSGLLDSVAGAIIASAPDGIMLVDLNGTILLANETMAQISGYSAEALVGLPVEVFLPPAMHTRHHANVRSHAQHPMRRPMGRLGNLSLLRRDGISVPVDISLSQCQTDKRIATVVFVRDMTGVKRMEQQMQYQATHDSLTGLVNRWMFHQHLNLALAQSLRQRRPLALLLLDLDDFKSINDGYGHAVGDKILLEVAHRLAAVLRGADTLARLGGDEFIVLLPEILEVADATQVASKLLAALGRPALVDGNEIQLGGSIGLVVCPRDAQDAETLLRYADMAMYRAKAAGRGTFAVYSASMGAQMREKLQLQERLKLALETGGLMLHYQPQVDVLSGRIIGAEALLRWHDTELGEIAPARFIPIAEASGLILPLGEWVMRSACQQAAAWARAGTPLRVGINLSARQFRQQRLAQRLGEQLAEFGTPAELIELEITESEAMADPQQTKDLLRELCQLGVGIALDDFGTGYSSLAYLREFPITRLKIDRAFIQPIAEREADATLVRAVLALAHAMHLSVVAEGVEQTKQLDFLREHGCDCYQGWLFSKALPATQFEALLGLQLVQKV
ncbi:putative bifunctional diguanylate cyclase/phosphodiesterase [Variovorax sp. HJSM1_2]|uniref:putative bifunctional diguanylate cyclase/phosphodiesterase n=1 Tax=Variovorax sp. HJSM1_2 TaxID=3366263 RepID=UPI003BF5FC02